MDLPASTPSTAAEACQATSVADFLALPELIEQLGDLGYDVVEMMLADQDSWDRYCAARWLNLRRWLDRNPDDELAPEVRPSSPPSPHATRATCVNISAGESSP